MSPVAIEFEPDALEAFCRRWKISELSLFGSVLREDFGPGSDVDLLVAFERDAHVSVWDLDQLCEELRRMFGRQVDVLTRSAVESHPNPWLRASILRGARKVFEAA